MNNSPKSFKNEIWQYYKKNKRSFAWRETKDPYHILVSEIMLQQTQTSRVISKYEEFLKRFPTIKKLGEAELSEVLLAWQGLGYNRRAKALKKSAALIQSKFKGLFPTDYENILGLPGVGQSTAGALMAFAYNKPFPFIETNIRAVFIYFFFKDKEKIKDLDILHLIEKTIDRKNPREWFYALYDYGAMLKASGTQLNSKSSHYKKQSTFKGSNREIRSNMLRLILKEKRIAEKKIKQTLNLSEEIVKKNLEAFKKEGLITQQGKNKLWHIA